MADVVFFETSPGLRVKLGKLLTNLPGISLAIPAASGDQLLHMCQTIRWNLAIVDLLAPGEDALGLLATLREACPNMPVLAVSFMLERQTIEYCVALGVRALIASEDIPDELEPAIRAVLAGQTYFSQPVREAQHATDKD